MAKIKKIFIEWTHVDIPIPPYTSMKPHLTITHTSTQQARMRYNRHYGTEKLADTLAH